MNSITFRSASPEDLPVLLEFEQGIIAAERPFNSNLKPDPISYYDIKAMIPDNRVEVKVAVSDGQIVASGYLRLEQASNYYKYELHGYIGFIYVRPHFRGQGLSGKIINELVAWARTKGVEEVHLEVYSNNLAAIRSYEKAGFVKQIVRMRLEND